MHVTTLCSMLVALPLISDGFLLRDQSNWNGLKVTWGINPFSSFKSIPRTKSDALNGGWVKMDTSTACDANANFLGERFWKDNDQAVILLFDPNGFIAGMQAAITKDDSRTTNPNQFPFPALINKPFVLVGNTYLISAYFVNPAHLCHGRTRAQFDSQGTGTGLWIQNGPNPLHDSVVAPSTESEADSSMWTKGVCFPSMGLHYWYDISKDMSCDNLYPVFLLYNGGVLNAFGWAFGMDIESSSRLEHPPQSSYKNFMNPVPDCLASLGTLTTLHIYLTNSATQDLC